MSNIPGNIPPKTLSPKKDTDSTPIDKKTSIASILTSGSVRKIDDLTDTESIEIPVSSQSQNPDVVDLKNRHAKVQEKSISLEPKSESWWDHELEEKRVILKAFWDQRIIKLNQNSVDDFKNAIINEHFPQSKEWENQIEKLFSDAISGQIEFETFFDTLKSIPWWPILGMDNSEKLDKPTSPTSKEKIEEINPKITNDDVIKIEEYMQEKGMSGSICLGTADEKLVTPKITEDMSSSTYAIHSIGKVFTGMLALLMVKEGILSDDDLHQVPVQLDESVIKALPPHVRERLKHVSLHQLMTHKAGLGNYIGAYIGAIAEGKNPEMKTPNDFLQFAEDQVFPVDEKRYSNLGILIVGLAIQHAYEKKYGACEYNEILKKYIIDEVGLPSFSLQKPENAKFNQADPIGPHFEGSPAGGYWMTVEDLAKFGQWIYKKTDPKSESFDPELESLMEKYGEEFYNAKQRVVFHTGDIPSASALLAVSLKTGGLCAILSDQPYMAFELFRVVQENVFSK